MSVLPMKLFIVHAVTGSFIKGNQLKQYRCQCGQNIFFQTSVIDIVNIWGETTSVWLCWAASLTPPAQTNSICQQRIWFNRLQEAINLEPGGGVSLSWLHWCCSAFHSGCGCFCGNSYARKGLHCQQIAAKESAGYLNFIDQLFLPLVQGLLYWICCFSIDPTCLSKADFLSPNALMPLLANVICFCGSQRAPGRLGGDLLSVNCNRLS